MIHWRATSPEQTEAFGARLAASLPIRNDAAGVIYWRKVQIQPLSADDIEAENQAIQAYCSAVITTFNASPGFATN